MKTRAMVQRRERHDTVRGSSSGSEHRRINPMEGHALYGPERSRFEQSFGHDFSKVRIFHESTSAPSKVGESPAFTVGSDIHLPFDGMNPESERFVLAHELAHIVQREQNGDLEGRTSEPGDAAEVEATEAAALVTMGASAPSLAAPAAAVSAFSLDPSVLWNTITDNGLSGAVGLITEASKTAASPVASGLGLVGAAGESSGIPMLGRLLGPLGIISNVMSMDTALGTGGAQGAGDFVAAANGLVGSIAPTLELGAAGASALGLEGAAAGMGSAASALGPIGAVAGSFAGGYSLGTHLHNHTSVGERSQDSLGWIDGMLTGEGERSWMLRQSEEFDDSWNQGDVLGVIGNGLQIGGAATAGAIGGLAGGAVDALSWLGEGIGIL